MRITKKIRRLTPLEMTLSALSMVVLVVLVVGYYIAANRGGITSINTLGNLTKAAAQYRTLTNNYAGMTFDVLCADGFIDTKNLKCQGACTGCTMVDSSGQSVVLTINTTGASSASMNVGPLQPMRCAQLADFFKEAVCANGFVSIPLLYTSIN